MVDSDSQDDSQELRATAEALRGHPNVRHLQLWGRALSDPTRLVIMSLLKARGELTGTDLRVALRVSQPAVSQHMALLEDAGFVSSRRRRKWRAYTLRPGAAALLPDV